MKMPRTSEERIELIVMLRNMVRAQIELWDFALEVAEILEVDLPFVLEYCQHAAIVADTGLELGETDLQDLLHSLPRAPVSDERPGGRAWIM
jgi:thymidylate synthase ThyX